MSITKKYSKLLRQARQSVAYWAQIAKRDFTDDLLKVMGDADVNQARLARLLNVSPQFVTKILRTNANLTIETMAKIALVLGCQVRIHIASRDSVTAWKDLPDNVTRFTVAPRCRVLPFPNTKLTGAADKLQTEDVPPLVVNG